MTISREKIHENHPDDLLLSYLDGLLSDEQRSEVKNHLDQCDRCAMELKNISKTIGYLRKNNEVFCPEPWLLIDYVEKGTDPDQLIAKHIQTCGLCKAELEECRRSHETTALPDRLKIAINEVFPENATTLVPKQTFYEKFLNKIQCFSIRPIFAFGTLVAAIFALVTFYPAGSPQTIIGMSQLEWDVNGEIPKPKSLFMEKPQQKVATVIIFEDSKNSIPQSLVDSLYEASKPSPQIVQKFKMINPRELSEFIQETKKFNYQYTEILKRFFSEKNVSFALIAKISLFENATSKRYKLDVSLLDTTRNEIVNEQRLEVQTEGELIKAMDSMSYILDELK